VLKKIATTELALGMYVERLGRSWLDTPFWKRSFLLQSSSDLERVRAAGLRDVWIDTARGLPPHHRLPIERLRLPKAHRG